MLSELKPSEAKFAGKSRKLSQIRLVPERLTPRDCMQTELNAHKDHNVITPEGEDATII